MPETTIEQATEIFVALKERVVRAGDGGNTMSNAELSACLKISHDYIELKHRMESLEK